MISKLAKARFIHKEHIIQYWPEAVRQLSTVFGLTNSERLPTIVSFLSTLMSLKQEELPVSEKIFLVDLVLTKIHQQRDNSAAHDAEDYSMAQKALCEFFHSVSQLFLHILTASGRNSTDFNANRHML